MLIAITPSSFSGLLFINNTFLVETIRTNRIRDEKCKKSKSKIKFKEMESKFLCISK